MRHLPYLALVVLSTNLAPHGMAQISEDGFSNDTAKEQFLHKIPLQYADAQSVEQTITKLFPHVSVASEQQTNTIYVRVDGKALVELHEFAEAVETEAKAQQKKAEEDEQNKGRELKPHYEIKAPSAEDSPMHVHAFKLSEVQDEEFLLQMLRVAVEPYGGKFAWDADKRHLVGAYPEGLHVMIKPLLSVLSNPRALPSLDGIDPQNPFGLKALDAFGNKALELEPIRHKALELEALRSTLGSQHPKTRQLERNVESFLKRMAAGLTAQFDSLSDRPNRQIRSLPFSQDTQEFHQHEETAAALAAEVRDLQPMEDTSEGDAKVAELLEQLKAAVNAAFSARQDMQKAEASALREQLERIEARIERRADIRERIVARRIAELLQTTPEDAWEPVLPRSSNVRVLNADDFDDESDPFAGPNEPPEPEPALETEVTR